MAVTYELSAAGRAKLKAVAGDAAAMKKLPGGGKKLVQTLAAEAGNQRGAAQLTVQKMKVRAARARPILESPLPTPTHLRSHP